jgi:hypothetical protein
MGTNSPLQKSSLPEFITMPRVHRRPHEDRRRGQRFVFDMPREMMPGHNPSTWFDKQASVA